MQGKEGRGLAFAVSVSSFTQDGFIAVTSFEGKRVELHFDDRGEGVFLPHVMAERLGAEEGGEVTVRVEAEHEALSRARYSGPSKDPRISDAKVYYAVGREGGAVVSLATD